MSSALPVAGGSQNERPGPFAPEFSRQARGSRLCQVYPPPGSDVETEFDIIAIHGLDTKSPDMWIWKSGELSVNWLQDSHMLPERFPKARIFTCDWPAELWEDPNFVQKTFVELARHLLAAIKSRPTVANDPDRKIVFIASCLGGIILMKALVMADNEYLSVKQATGGIVFLATPFQGSSFQDVAKWAEPGLKTWALLKNKKVSNLLQYAISNDDVDELVRSFTGFYGLNNVSRNVATFYETKTSSLPRKLFSRLPASMSQQKLVRAI